jgi:D-proline reductase (dithiol) PrdB
MESPDAAMRAYGAGLPVPTFAEPAFVTPPPIESARVAIVTTAGLTQRGEGLWTPGETSFRVIGREERELTLGHLSPNFDRTGVAADLNVVYPIDRLEELARDNLIGGVAPRHVSFQGAIVHGEPAAPPGTESQLTTIIVDSGPAAAKLLRDDGVDVAILTPV